MNYYKTKSLIAIIIICIYYPFNISLAQLSIINVDTNSFPIVKSNGFLFGNDYRPIIDLKKTDFVVKENSQDLKITDLILPNQSIEENSSIVLCFDLAIDTSLANNSNFSLAKKIFNEIIKNAPSNNSEIALNSFDIFSYINQDFSNDKTKLQAIINNYIYQNASIINDAFLPEFVGAIDICKRGKYAKSLVIITDKISTANIDSIVNEANKYAIKIFWINLEKEAKYNLNTIAEKTNGKYFGSINNNSDIIALSKSIIALSFNYKPYELVWDALLDCSETRDLEIINKTQKANTKYNIYNWSKPELDIEPSYLGFSGVLPSKTKDLVVKLTAKVRDIIITKFKIAAPFSIYAGDVQGASLKIKKGESHNLTIRYSPSDSSLVYTILQIVSDACIGDEIILTGGFPNTPPKESNLNISNPICKQTFIAGDSVDITWSGLLPRDVVQLEYSTNNGATWDTLAKDVTGLKYRWEVPYILSDSCLIRVIQLWPNNVGETVTLLHYEQVNSAMFDADGYYVISSCKDKKAKIWNSNTGELISQLVGHNKTVKWANFSPDGLKAVTASEDSTAIIWNFGPNYTNPSIAYILKGHTGHVRCANFSPDSKKIITVGADGKAIIWSTETGNQLDILCNRSNTPLWHCLFSSNGQYIITTGYGGKVEMWNAATKYIEKTFHTGKALENLSYVTMSNDMKKIAAASWFGRAIVWDVDKEDTIYTVQHFDDSGVPQGITSVGFNSDGKLLLTSSFDYSAKMWNGENGKYIMNLLEHTNSVECVCFNFDASRVLTSSLDSSAKVWNLNKRDLQSGFMDCPFAISVPVAKLLDTINFGQVILDTPVDSLISDFIINLSKFDYPIQKIEITGDNKDDFTQIDFFPPYSLDSASSSDIRIRFQPLGVGIRKAKLEITIPKNQLLIINLVGEGVESGLKPIANYIDFGQVELGDFKDSLINVIVQNRSKATNINISSIRIIEPDTLHFKIVSGSNTITLKPGESHNMELRFIPESIGLSNSLVAFQYDTTKQPLKISLFGEGIPVQIDTLSISISSAVAKPGDIVEAIVSLKNIGSKKLKTPITGVNTELTFNSSMLEPIYSDSKYSSIIEGNERLLKLNIPYNYNADFTNSVIRFKVGLGNDTITKLSLANSFPETKAKVHIIENSGIFKLEGICNEGGLRLLDFNNKFSLSENTPNPANQTTQVKYQVLENTYITMYLLDVLGNKIKVLLEGNIKPGDYTHTIDVSDLPNGTYFCILQSLSQRTVRKIDVRK